LREGWRRRAVVASWKPRLRLKASTLRHCHAHRAPRQETVCGDLVRYHRSDRPHLIEKERHDTKFAGRLQYSGLPIPAHGATALSPT
jgi:hypothetical protein